MTFSVKKEENTVETGPINVYFVEILQSHFNLTMCHWSSELTLCFPSQGTWVQFPRGVLMWNRDSPVSVVLLQFPVSTKNYHTHTKLKLGGAGNVTSLFSQFLFTQNTDANVLRTCPIFLVTFQLSDWRTKKPLYTYTCFVEEESMQDS